MRLRQVLERRGEPLLLGATQQLAQPLHRRSLHCAQLLPTLLERGTAHLPGEAADERRGGKRFRGARGQRQARNSTLRRAWKGK